MALSTATTETGRLPAPAKKTVFALVVGAAAAILDSTIVTIALDTLTSSLDATTAQVQWVATGYLLALVASIPLSGWAQSRFGGRRAWIGALTIFLVFSTACALSWNIASLIAFRVFQGLGAGLVFPLMQTLAMQTVGKASRAALGKMVVLISVPLALGPILGPIAGGAILHWLDWRWMFIVNVPLVALGIVLAVTLIPRDAPRAAHSSPGIDPVGLVLLSPALVALLLGLSHVSSLDDVATAGTVVPVAIGALLLALFIVWALRRRESALVDITLLRHRSLASSTLMLFLAGAALYSGMFLLPLFWQQLRGASVLTAALVLVPQGVGALLARVAAGKLAVGIGARATTALAFAVSALATVPFAFADQGTSEWWLAAVLFVRGLGIGMVIMGPMMTAYADVAHDEMPHATMITRVIQQVGSSFGVALLAVVLTSASTQNPSSGFHAAFWWATAIAALGLVLTLTMRRESVEDAPRA